MRSAPKGWMQLEQEYRKKMRARSKLGSRKQKFTAVDVVLFSACTSGFFYFIL